MPQYVVARWQPDPTAPGPRRSRMGGTFRACVPDPLVPRRLDLDARVAADVSDAERAISTLDATVDATPHPHRLEVLARLLLRAEAVGSSQIEGLVVSPRRLALASLDPELDAASHARDVVGNIHALRDALTLADRPGPVTVEDLCALHASLMAGTRDAHLGGLVRREQNWIGGRTPLDAAFVPPPPRSACRRCSTTCARTSPTTRTPRSSRRRSCTPGSRPSIRSPMETVEPAAR